MFAENLPQNYDKKKRCKECNKWQYSIQWLISSDIRVVVCNLIQPATLKHKFHSYVRVRLSEVYSNIWFFRENAQIIWFIWGNVQKVVELGKNNETKLNSGYIGLKHCEQCWGFWKFRSIKISKRGPNISTFAYLMLAEFSLIKLTP